MTKISQIPNPLVGSDVNDKSKVEIPVADTQTNPPGSGDNFRAGLDEVQYVVTNETITSTAHGLTAAKEGSPLYGVAILDDTASGEYGMWLLLDYIDADNFRIVPPGVAMDIPVAKIEDGASYDVTVKGYELYWDASAGTDGQYVSTQPVDSDHPHAIHVVSVGASTFRAKLIERQLDWSLDQGGVKIHPNNYISGGATVGHVAATGVGATDSAAFAAAIAAYDVVRIDDSAAALELDDGTIHDMGTVILEGHSTQRARINLSGGTTLRWGDYGDFGTKLTQAVGTNGWQDCAVADDGGTITATEVLDIGDIMVVAADNSLPDVSPHFAGGNQRPLEIARIVQIEDGSVADQTARLALTGLLTGERIFQVDNSTVYQYDGGGESNPSNWSTPGGDIKYVLERRLEDTYSTNVRYYLYVDGSGDPVLSLGGGMTNLDFTGSSNPAGTTAGFLVYHCHYWEARNVHYANTGSMSLFGCYSARTYDCKCYGQTDPGAIYGFAYVGVTDLRVHRYESQKCRHFATSGGWGTTPNRWGSNTGVEFLHCIGTLTGVESGSTVGWDTHADGLGVKYYRCKAILGGDNDISSGAEWNLYGFQSRSRKTEFTECQVIGSNAQKHIGFRIYSAVDNRIIRSEQNGGAIAVYCKSATATYGCDRTVIKDCDFDDLSRNAILIDGGVDCLIEKTTITNSGGSAAGYDGATASAITLSENEGEDVSAVIRNNYLPKASNTASIRYPDDLTISEIKLYDNRTTGYATDLGLDAGLANTATLLAEYDGQNNQNTEGTAILSTGETGGTKFLREDGDGTCSWQNPTAAATGYDNALDWCTADGVVDDTQNLRDAIANSDKALFLPPGTYRVTDTIVIPQNKRIFGSGRNSIIKGDGISGTKPVLDVGRLIKDYTVDHAVDNEIDFTGHLLEEGQLIRFYGWTGSTAYDPKGGMARATPYYVYNPSANSFQISTNPADLPGSVFTLTSFAGSGTSNWGWYTSAHVELSNFKIVGTGATQDAIGLRIEASSRYSITDLYIDSIGIGAHLGYQLDDVPAWGGWIPEVRNIFITNCGTLGLGMRNCNGGFINANIENSTGTTTTQYFKILNSQGTTIRLQAEGEFPTTTSDIDRAQQLNFPSLYMEYAGDGTPDDEPMLTIGRTGASESITIDAGYFGCGSQHVVPPVHIERCDGGRIIGRVETSTRVAPVSVNQTAGAVSNFDVSNLTEESAGIGTRRYAAPITITELPLINYWPNPFHDLGLPELTTSGGDVGGIEQVSCTATLETTTVLPGHDNAIKLTDTVGSNTAASALWRTDFTGTMAALKNQDIVLAAYIYAPSTYYDPATTTRYPFIQITNQASAGKSSAHSQVQRINDNWCVVCVASTGNLPDGADTQSWIRIYLQNDATNQTVANQYIIVGGILAFKARNVADTVLLGKIARGEFSHASPTTPYLKASVPGVNEDIKHGFWVGTTWVNTATDTGYMCVDNADGAASWKQITA